MPKSIIHVYTKVILNAKDEENGYDSLPRLIN